MFMITIINLKTMLPEYRVPVFLLALYAFVVALRHKTRCNYMFLKKYGITVFEFVWNKVEVYSNQKLQAKFTMDEVEIIYIDNGIVFCKKLKKKRISRIKYFPIPFFFDGLSIAEKETLLKIIKESQIW